jgi:diguanylate cyclase (GGDEF)-like protein/PAS domain S-box-containing protein
MHDRTGADQLDLSGHANDKSLRILIVEDVPADAELCQRELRRAGLKFTARCVETRGDFERALQDFEPDLILSDFSMPSAFDGLTALDLTRAKFLYIPFVFVSGTIGEDRAVEAMKRGATDYVLKDRLNRLVPVIQRALREEEERAARRKIEHELEETRSRLDNIVSSLPDVVWSYSVRDRRLLYVSPGASGIYRRPLTSLIANPTGWMDLVHPEDRERVERDRRESLSTRLLDSTYRVVLSDGEVRWIHDRGRVIASDKGELLRIDGLARDVTELKLQEQRIRRLSRIHAVLSGINSAIVRIDDRQMLFEEACNIAVEHGGFAIAWIGALNPETLELIPVAWAGVDAESFLAHSRSTARADASLGEGVAARAVRETRAVYSNDLLTEPTQSGERRKEAIRRGYRSVVTLPLLVGETVVGNLSLFAKEANFFDDEEMKLLTGLADDISFALDHIAKGEKLNYLAYYDVLTGLPNRTLFLDRLEQRVSAARREQKIFSVLMLDIERFRQINETLGRKSGDDLLREFSQRLRGALEDTDVLAHIGGDYFAVASGHAEQTGDIVRMLDQVLTEIAGRPFMVGGSELRIASRAGVAVYPADGADADGLLKNAEAAHKDARRTGHRYLFYAPQMNARVAEQLKLENDLRRAVLEEQFVLHYQTRVDLVTGTVTGFEALMRWLHPELGLVSPGEFIPLLESTGLILEAGRWALRRAAQDHAAWRAEGLTPPRIAVNVSAIQLRRQEFVEDVMAALAGTHGFQHIDIEITESMLMEDVDGNIEKLQAIQAIGMQVALDDFGTGYCSLSYLAKLPVNSLKIDRSFVSQMANRAEQMAIVSTIVSLARALSLKVVAEGVETQEQANLLRLLRCDEAQGFLFGRPEPWDQAGKRL